MIDNFNTFEDEVGSGPSTYTVTLTITDGASGSDQHEEIVDIDLLPSCGFTLSQVQAYVNCSAIALVWNNPSYWTPDNYYIYRSTSSNCDTAPESCSWSLIATPDSGDGTSYDDSNVSEGVNYWYYISMDPTQLNNSTAGCTGTQGTSGDMCALADAPTCPVTPRSVTSTHRCGAIIVGWDKTTDAETYKLQRAVGEPSGEGDYTDITTIDGG